VQLTVTDLDLSSNKLGGAGFGEALRCLLEENSVLRRLELGWNGAHQHAPVVFLRYQILSDNDHLRLPRQAQADHNQCRF
jgi:hypothetical protein